MSSNGCPSVASHVVGKGRILYFHLRIVEQAKRAAATLRHVAGQGRDFQKQHCVRFIVTLDKHGTAASCTGRAVAAEFTVLDLKKGRAARRPSQDSAPSAAVAVVNECRLVNSDTGRGAGNTQSAAAAAGFVVIKTGKFHSKT